VETIIITLRKEDGQELDLEVPREVCAADLVEELALAFGLSGDFQVFAEPPNRMLAPHETLAQAGSLGWGAPAPDPRLPSALSSAIASPAGSSRGGPGEGLEAARSGGIAPLFFPILFRDARFFGRVCLETGR
jgi:hypothetical protein